MILGGIARKGVASIFDLTAGKTELTPEQLRGIQDCAFDDYEMAHISDAISALSLTSAVYNPYASVETRKNYVLHLREESTRALEMLDAQIKNTDTFFKLTADYIYAKTIQLTFKAEEFVLDGGAGIHTVMAEDAAKGIGDVRRYFESYFHDPQYDGSVKARGGNIHGVVPCVKWDFRERLLFSHGGGEYKTENPNRPEASNEFCMGWFGEYMSHNWPIVDFTFFSHSGVFKHPRRDLWFFTYRKEPGKPQLWVWAAGKEEFAKAERFARSMNQFPETLGEISSHLLGWHEIVKTLSKDVRLKQQALQDMVVLGLN